MEKFITLELRGSRVKWMVVEGSSYLLYVLGLQVMKVGPKLQMWTVGDSNDVEGPSKVCL